jgi:hypothetical protein
VVLPDVWLKSLEEECKWPGKVIRRKRLPPNIGGWKLTQQRGGQLLRLLDR